MRRVLLIEDNPIEARILSADFQKKAAAEFDLISVRGLAEAFQVLTQNPIDVILLDLFLEDSAGLETLSRVREAALDAPVVVLTGLNDETLALEALKNGAQDYLIKGGVETHALFRAIRYAIERKQAERDRRLLEQRLLQSQKLEAVGILARGVAHNFNNALTVILGHSNFLLEPKMATDHVGRPHVDAIVRSGEKAAALIRQLLAFSRKRTTEFAVFSLNKLILDMHMLFESALEEVAELELELKLNAESEFIKANPSQIGQMLMNLVMNARNAMPTGGKLTIETSNSGDDKVLLTIRDTGCGMSPETCSHAFEPFFTTKCLAEASGLGLSTVYGIVQQHFGNIEVSSKLGEGATFSVVFPTLSAFTANTKRAQPSTILIVRGPETFSDVQLDALDGEYTIIKANNWAEALAVADAYGGPIDLLIADTVTPRLLTPHLVKQLASERPDMKIIYISQDSAKKFRTNKELPGGIHLLQTELTPESMLQSVTEALGANNTRTCERP